MGSSWFPRFTKEAETGENLPEAAQRGLRAGLELSLSQSKPKHSTTTVQRH